MKKRFAAITAAALCIGVVVGVGSAGLVESIKAEIRRDFTIEIDGKKQTFKNVNGEAVYPLLYEGTTYLPVRAIGELMGKTVYWYEDEKLIELKSESTTVTDADVIVDSKTKPDKNTDESKNNKDIPGGITLEEAKQKVFDRAGVKASDVTVEKAKAHKEHGIDLYEIEFMANGMEYEVEITLDGAVYKWEEDGYLHHITSGQGTDRNAAEITLDEAKAIALKKAGLKENQVVFKEAKVDYEGGVKVYEIEFTKDKTEYEAEIKAADGTILKWKVDKE